MRMTELLSCTSVRGVASVPTEPDAENVILSITNELVDAPFRILPPDDVETLMSLLLECLQVQYLQQN